MSPTSPWPAAPMPGLCVGRRPTLRGRPHRREKRSGTDLDYPETELEQLFSNDGMDTISRHKHCAGLCDYED
ncbi:hypothetical protein ACFQE5_03305 [Pseudonocardia hispaniensis]|uniref:Uncharacterized protein n=1 Tax=Pseudonocardia hispaniensis TaxID=904933 RepID=A0ABW1IY09_9PSEU